MSYTTISKIYWVDSCYGLTCMKWFMKHTIIILLGSSVWVSDVEWVAKLKLL